ncbi:hypothetical protein GCM10020254_21200 [Streptomyces goshikiensis]
MVHPDGRVDFPELPAGLPLGVGGMPFETAELWLAEGSRLALFTDGLLEDRDRDFDTGQALLREALAQPGRSPEQACADVLAALLFPAPSDDIALLVADTRRLEPDRIAEWEVPGDPSAVSRVRNAGSAQLVAWGGAGGDRLHHRAHPQRARHQRDPVREPAGAGAPAARPQPDLRGLRRQQHLPAPAVRGHHRRGGRGLFLVAQYADRWGTRYTERGKVIWAEVPLTGGADPASTALDLDSLEDLAW